MTIYAEVAFRKIRDGVYGVLAAYGVPVASDVVGDVKDSGPVGWTATFYREPGRGGLQLGLFPDRQAAGEALLKRGGYELA